MAMEGTIMKYLLLSLALALWAPPILAEAEQAWVMSIPYALSAEHIYKVNITAIDGTTRPAAVSYPLPAGKHRITAELMLDVEWEPDLLKGRRPPAVKVFELDVEAGKSYRLGARVDVDAPIEAQLNQSYWEVFVYQVL